MKRIIFVLLIFAATATQAQNIRTGMITTDPPKLTESQILTLRNHIKDIEIAQLKMKIVEQDFTRARDAAQTLIQSLQVKGYNLDLDKMVYVPAPPPPNEQ